MKYRGGFTLAEVMVAMFVLTVVILFLVGLITTGLAVGSKGEESVTAAHVAESVMGRWKSRPFSELEALSGLEGVQKTQESDGREYHYRFTVSPLTTAGPDGKLLRLSVLVEWLENTSLSAQGSKAERPASFRLDSVVAPGAML